MTRKEVYKEIEELCGFVPTFFKKIPDSMIEHEWELFKQVQFGEGPISRKDRQLIGLAISAVTKCQYCLFYHTELARVFGASDEEIEDAMRMTKLTTGWSSYVTGIQLDFEQFKDEVLQACEHMRSMQMEHAM